MFQTAPMHFTAPLLPDDFVKVIDDVEYFFIHGWKGLLKDFGQQNKLIKAYCFRADL